MATERPRRSPLPQGLTPYRHKDDASLVGDSSDGFDVYLVALAVTPLSGPVYGVKLGNPVPDAALPLLTVGRDVPAKRNPAASRQVVIDWNAVAAEALSGGKPLS